MNKKSFLNHLQQHQHQQNQHLQQIKKANFKKKIFAFIEIIVCHLISFFKRMLKIFLKFTTKLTEIERICLREKIESIRIRKIGK